MSIHFIQKEIIRELGFADDLAFGDFKCRSKYEPDLFNYHLQKLVKTKLANKDKHKKYSLTPQGKELLSNLNVTAEMGNVKQPKVVVQAFIVKDDQVLLAKRLKHPFKDTIGFVSGKVDWGEDFEETLVRESVEEIGIVPIKYELSAIRRCVDYNKKDGKLIFDSIYFTFKITDYSGEIKNTEESENIWYKLDEIDVGGLLPVTAAILKEHKENGKIEFFKVISSNSLEL